MIYGLVAGAMGIAVVHSLAPDHWLPFVAIGRARNWSIAKVALVAFLGALGHVLSSVLLGSVGIALGLAQERLTKTEETRATIAAALLVGFGIAYALWGLKHARTHAHTHDVDVKKTVTMWALIAIFVLGPCEPLIPMMFGAMAAGWHAVWLVAVGFSLVTMAMMMGQTLLAFAGVRLLRFEGLERYGHVIGGLVIAVTGVAIKALGI
ncbi:MAG: hypothetical protein ACE5R4_05655 [Armatimonadota bacterium]